MEKIIVIAGPTASGKTSLAVNLAKRLNGEIISADSMQIYKGMDIGTAKVSEEETCGIRHHCIDIVEPCHSFSAAEYALAAHKAIGDIISRGKTAIVAGGTGLYIEGILYGFSFGESEKDDALRRELEERYAKDDGKTLYEELLKIDYRDAVKFHPNNKRRLIRAMEIYLSTGKCKSEHSSLNDKKLLYDAKLFTVSLQREELYERINRRVDIMFDCGLKEEVDRLLAGGVTFDMQSMQAIGYKEFAGYYDGQDSLEQVKELIKKNSRNYAKRQITWFKRYDFARNVGAEDIDEIIRSI